MFPNTLFRVNESDTTASFINDKYHGLLNHISTQVQWQRVLLTDLIAEPEQQILLLEEDERQFAIAGPLLLHSVQTGEAIPSQPSLISITHPELDLNMNELEVSATTNHCQLLQIPPVRPLFQLNNGLSVNLLDPGEFEEIQLVLYIPLIHIPINE